MSKEKLLASAQKNLQKGQIGKAVKDYQKIVESDPKDFRNRQKLAELLSRDRMIAEALKEYEAVARHYAETGFYLKAIAVYKQMQRLDPARPEFYLRLAELNEKQGLIGNALGEYRNLASHYEKNRMFVEQLKILRKIGDLDPENFDVKVKVVELSIDNEEKDARHELQEVLDLLATKNDSSRALRLYNHFVPKFPGDLLLLAGQADVLVKMGETARGEHLLHDILRQDADHEKALRLLARVFLEQGKHQDALHAYQRLLDRQPENLELRQGQIVAAIEAGEKVLASRELLLWEEALVAAGRENLVRELQARLQIGESSGAETDGSSAADSSPCAARQRLPNQSVPSMKFS